MQLVKTKLSPLTLRGRRLVSLVEKHSLPIKLCDDQVRAGKGEFTIVPKGVEHKPVAEKETHVALLESKPVINTGNVRSESIVVDVGWV